jgi:uncharacterized protein YggT (Ycf19 family)
MTYQTPETEPVERREEVDPAPPPPAAGGQVNVNSGAAAPVYVAERSPMVLARRVVGLLFGVIVALIGLRIVLLALGANAGNAIVDGIYSITEPLVAPFRGVFSIDQVRPTGNNEIDIAALVAIVGWSLIALLIIAILRIPERRA